MELCWDKRIKRRFFHVNPRLMVMFKFIPRRCNKVSSVSDEEMEIYIQIFIASRDQVILLEEIQKIRLAAF